MSESHAADSPDDERRAAEERLRRRNALDRVYYLIKRCEEGGGITLAPADAALIARYVTCLRRGLERQEVRAKEGSDDAFRARIGEGYL